MISGDSMENILIRTVPDEILTVAIKPNITFYDSSCMMLAKTVKTKFVTADEILVRKTHRYFPRVSVILSDILPLD